MESELQFDRLPPHSIEAEMCLLASMMLDRDMAMACMGIVTGESFFQADHQIIFDVVAQLYRSKKPVDPVIVVECLGSRQLLDEVGGAAYIGAVLNKVPSYAHGEHYAEIVREKFVLREAIRISNQILRDAYAPCDRDDANRFINRAASSLVKLGSIGKASTIRTLGDAVVELVDSWGEGTSRYIKTGLHLLDDQIGGVIIGGVTIIAGRPGMGKSAAIKQILLNLARAGIPVGVITVEETGRKIAENMLSSESGVINKRISHGTMSDAERAQAIAAMPALAALPYYIEDAAATLTDISNAARVLANKHGCQVIAVDHLHIVDGEPDRGMNREREISKISAGLKLVWKELGVAGIEAAQLNRGSGKERPTLASLRDSGSLEQDGDTVLLLHREDYFKEQDAGPGVAFDRDGIVEFIIAKNKSGATGIVPLQFDGARQRITSKKEVDPFEVGAAEYERQFG